MDEGNKIEGPEAVFPKIFLKYIQHLCFIVFLKSKNKYLVY